MAQRTRTELMLVVSVCTSLCLRDQLIERQTHTHTLAAGVRDRKNIVATTASKSQSLTSKFNLLVDRKRELACIRQLVDLMKAANTTCGSIDNFLMRYCASQSAAQNREISQ